MYTIDKDIPVSNSCGNRGAKRKYPFPDMVIGDSVFIPADNGRAPEALRNSVGNAATATWGKRTAKTSVRSESGVLGVRVWRVA